MKADAALLEPVSVGAKGLFADGLFTYRVLPHGSIFVGPFGKQISVAEADVITVTSSRFAPA